MLTKDEILATLAAIRIHQVLYEDLIYGVEHKITSADEYDVISWRRTLTKLNMAEAKLKNQLKGA